MNNCPSNCDTVQIIEPRQDLLVDTAGNTSDIDERGELALAQGQGVAIVYFQVPKLNPYYNFEYLYVDAMGIPHPGTVIPIPTVRAVEGFAIVLAGHPPAPGYVMHWRVTISNKTALVRIDAPEDLYLQMPRANAMAITFLNPRSSANYGFSELRVENLHDPHQTQAIIRVQVYSKTISRCLLAVNPIPPTDLYFLRVRTP